MAEPTREFATRILQECLAKMIGHRCKPRFETLSDQTITEALRIGTFVCFIVCMDWRDLSMTMTLVTKMIDNKAIQQSISILTGPLFARYFV
jgi:hypothetical protein